VPGAVRPTRRQLAGQVADVLRDLPALLTAPLYRRRHLGWGATPQELLAGLPGDDLFPRAHYRSTRAITIHAPPESVWPWLVQVGCGRAGFYSHDLLDNLARPSATTVLAAFQHLEVGGWVPMSPSATPTDRTALRVRSFDVDRWLLWAKPDSSWVWQLTPDGQGGTRLVTRIHAVYEWRKHPLTALFGCLLMDASWFVRDRFSAAAAGIVTRTPIRACGCVTSLRQKGVGVAMGIRVAPSTVRRSSRHRVTISLPVPDVARPPGGDRSGRRLLRPDPLTGAASRVTPPTGTRPPRLGTVRMVLQVRLGSSNPTGPSYDEPDTEDPDGVTG
jgi:hypothetical protein